MNNMLMDKNTYDKWQELLDKEEQDEKSKEIERLNKRINKAIKYIEDMQKYPSYCDTWSTTAPHDVICILKGSDKE